MIALHKATDATGFANLSKSANLASRTFRDAAASTGMFEVQQLRLNSATDDYVKKMKAQKMSFRDMIKQRKIANAAYKEQLQMENMSLRRNPASSRSNKGVYDVIIPKDVSADVDTARKRLAFFNAELKSGAHQMVNWGKNTQWAGRQLMVGFTMPIAAFGAAAGVMAYQVDKELTRIQKVIDTNATTTMGIEKELAQVRVDGLKTATAAAKEYGSAATDTLNVQAELAATGLMGKELQGATGEVMRIARLGEVDNDTAIQATISLQSVFRDTIKTSEDLSDAFNYMNSIENATSLSTADFATAIPVAASSVKAFGGDVKELGILLTAMKENGIGASEGANALKATMQRLSRPSKQIQEEWKAITNTDITQLVDSSDGLVEVFTKINEATSGLDPDQQRKAFAGLFGSYQVSKMMALTKGMGELQEGIGQVSKAYEISQGNSEDWANTAQTEIERYQKSISGMWDIAFQSMKIELAEVGEPFVILGTKIVQGVAKILKTFNDFPNAIKYLVAAGVAATALAGAVLMLTGLFSNLTGNAIKVGSSIAGLVLKMNILDKESKAGLMVADMAAKGATHQMDAVKLLTAQIQKQTEAQRESNQVMAQAYNIPMGAGGAGAASPMLSPGAQNAATQQQRLAYEQSIRDKYKAQGPSGKVYNRDPSSASPWLQVSNSRVDEMVLRDLQTEAIEMNESINRTTKEAADLDAQRVKAAERRNRLQKQAGALMAVESAALAISLISTNETVDNIAQIVMFAGLMGPAYAGVAGAAGSIAGKFKEARAAQAATAAATAATATATTAAATGANAFAVGIGRAKAVMLAMMGPVGWTITAIGALGALVYKVAQDQKKVREQAIADQKELNNLASDYANSTGKTLRDYKSLQNVMLGIKSEREANEFTEDTDYFKDTSEQGGSKKVDAFNRLETDAQKAAYAQQMYIDLQVRAGMTGQRAATTIKALYSAAGKGAEAAAIATENLVDNLNDAEGINWENVFSNERTALLDAMGGDLEIPEDTFNRVAGLFSEAMTSATSTEDAVNIMDEFQSITQAGWQKTWDEVIVNNGIAMSAMQKQGISTFEELQTWWQSASESDKAMLFTNDFGAQLPGAQQFIAALEGADALETRFVKEYAEEFGNLGGEVEHFSDLMNDVNIQAKSLNLEDAANEVNAIVAATQVQGARGAEMSQEAARLAINAFNAANGFEEGSSMAEALYFWTNKVADGASHAALQARMIKMELNGAKGAASGLAAMLRNMSTADIAAAGKEAMQGMQNEMADNWTDQLDAQQQQESDANSDYWDAQKDAQGDRFDAQSDALSDQHDREQKGMEAAWDAKREGLENYWDKRIEAVDNAIEHEEKAEEKRQKMFDAEIARINKMADMANTKIDFNVALNEGNLDEAAKIANTAMASDAQSVFEREREKGAEKSAARVDRLGQKSENLSEQKDAAMEGFDKKEEAAKAHMQKMQEIESDSLQKRQDMARKDLEKRAEMDKDALDKTHERQKENLNRILKTFLASTPTTKAALQKQVKELGKALDDFGITILDPMSQKWGNWFKNRMRDGLTNSALEAQTAAAWEQFAESTKKKMLDAWGFTSEAEFFNFINGKTQVGMKGAGKSPVDATPQEAADAATGKTGPQTKKSMHSGGLVGSGVDSRHGVAKNYKGLHPSEVDITAQHGEYIINREAAKKFGPQLDAMNAGRGVGGKFGMAGRMGAVAVASIAKGLMKRGKDNLQAQRQAAAASGAGSGSYSSAGYVEGQGGWHRPSTPGLGWTNTHDYKAPKGTPVYATSDGVITRSEAITSGGSPGNGSIAPNGVPYRSYGETIQLQMADGNRMNFGHLSARFVGAGQHVKGGALMGLSGSTGNSSGPHLHMDLNPSENASGYLASRGIGLRKGAEYVKFDNTAANLHRGESVLTKRLTEQMHEGVERFANGDNSEYNVTVHINGYSGDADELARKVEKVFDRKARRRPSSRKVGKG